MLNKQNSPAGWTARPPGGPRLPVGRVSRLEGFSLVSGGPEVEVQLVPRDGPNLEDTVWRKSCWLATASQAREPNSGRRRLTIVLAIPQNWQKMCSSIERERSKEREEERKGGRGNKTRKLQKAEEEKKKNAMGKCFYCVIPSGLLMPGPTQTFSFSPPSFLNAQHTHGVSLWKDSVVWISVHMSRLLSGMFPSSFCSKTVVLLAKTSHSCSLTKFKKAGKWERELEF